MPIKQEGNSNVTHLDMYAVERLGFVKFDILGLTALTLIEKTRQMLASTGIYIEWDDEFSDSRVYKYLSTGNTYGIFQLDSFGIRAVIQQMKPVKFEELIALNALYRPGPIENIEEYIACRKNPEKIQYLFPELEEILSETYGIIVYQEQVLQIAQKVAGYTLGEADLLRRAIGKKIKSEMDKQKARFIGQAKRGEELFYLIEKFSQYGFVKAHAACYALIMYKTAYLKTVYTNYFICANMEIDQSSTLKMIQWIIEAKREKIEIFPPCINGSKDRNTIEGNGIRYGLRSIKGVGEGLAKKIIENQPFSKLQNFIKKVMPDKLGFESLAKSGALSIFKISVQDLLDNTLFLLNSTQNTLFPIEITKSQSEIFVEKQIQHHLSVMPDFLEKHPLTNLCLRSRYIKGSSEYICGILLHIDRRRSKSGNSYGVIYISHTEGTYEISIFSELWNISRSKLCIGHFLAIKLNSNMKALEIRTFNQMFDFTKIVLKIISPWANLKVLESLPSGKIDLALQANPDSIKYCNSISVDLNILYILSNIPDTKIEIYYNLKE